MKTGTCLDHGHPRDAIGADYILRSLDGLQPVLDTLAGGQISAAAEMLHTWRTDLASVCTFVQDGWPWPTRPATTATKQPRERGRRTP